MHQLGIALLWICALRAVSCNDASPCKSFKELGRKLEHLLSPASEVHLAGSDKFEAITTRWSNLETPAADIVVIPATENDVAQTVRVVTDCDLPILAFNGVHGSITTLGKMKRGVAIHLKRLASVEVSEDGLTATIGGGASSKDVIAALWASGKQTLTGTCECVSYLGPALGGGHGWLEGHHGLIADPILSMNVVLADGSQQTIDSSSDLWWAMKGAGHNFGIVTSVITEVHDIEHEDWAIETLIFTGDKVEAVYEAANQHLGHLPVDLINWSYWWNMPDLDPDNPVIEFYIIQEGVAAVDSIYTTPFHDLGPLSSKSLSGSYLDLGAWAGIDINAPPCQKDGLANPRFPIYLQDYNVTALKEAYDVFASHVRGTESLFNNSIFMFEAYPQQEGAVDGDSTAYAFRNDHLLAAPLITYVPTDKQLDESAARLGNQLRDILYQGSGSDELHAYVNYAYGNERPESWYGYEPWRLQRLRNLKQKYDPEGRFGFYGPIE